MTPSTITIIVVLSFIASFALVAGFVASDRAARKVRQDIWGGSAPSTDERVGPSKD